MKSPTSLGELADNRLHALVYNCWDLIPQLICLAGIAFKFLASFVSDDRGCDICAVVVPLAHSTTTQ